MPTVSPQIAAARQTVTDRFNTMKNWLEPEDIDAAAEATGLSRNYLAQIRKGVKWNQQGVEALIGAALERKAYYEKIAACQLDEETGKPFSAPLSDDVPGQPSDLPTTTGKPRKKNPRATQ